MAQAEQDLGSPDPPDHMSLSFKNKWYFKIISKDHTDDGHTGLVFRSHLLNFQTVLSKN